MVTVTADRHALLPHPQGRDHRRRHPPHTNNPLPLPLHHYLPDPLVTGTSSNDSIP